MKNYIYVNIITSFNRRVCTVTSKMAQLEDYQQYEDCANNILNNSYKQVMTFYPQLKELALAGNEKAIIFRDDIRNKPKSLMRMQLYISKKIEIANTIDEFLKIIKLLKSVSKQTCDYTIRFNDEIAIDGSGIEKINFENISSIYVEDGYDALHKFEKKSTYY